MKINLITADTGPLIHLASIGQLDLLKKFAIVHIPDLVVMEAVIPGKPWAQEISDWLAHGLNEKTVHIAETTTGELLRLARLSKPDHRIKDGGELAILNWLVDAVEASKYSAMVIYENGKVPKLIQNHESELSAIVLTTKAFFYRCEKEGFIKSAEALWDKLIKDSPDTNPRSTTTYFGRVEDEELKP